MSTVVAPEVSIPARPGQFMGADYYKSLATRVESGRLLDKFLTVHVGSTAVGKLVEKTAPVEVATRINALTPLKLLHAAKSWRATRDRLQKEKEYALLWDNFQGAFLDHAHTSEEVRVLQIGAYDGITHDRMNPLLSANPEWKAVLVEPMPAAFDKLTQTYAQRPNTALMNVAVGDSNGDMDMFYIRQSKSTPLFIDLTTTSRPENLSQFMEAGGDVDTVTVPSVNLDSLLRQSGLEADNIDMLFVDAEGCDYSILKQALSLGSPKFIVAEHDHMSDEEYSDVTSSLAISGYRVQTIAHDILAVKEQ